MYIAFTWKFRLWILYSVHLHYISLGKIYAQFYPLSIYEMIFNWLIVRVDSRGNAVMQMYTITPGAPLANMVQIQFQHGEVISSHTS